MSRTKPRLSITQDSCRIARIFTGWTRLSRRYCGVSLQWLTSRLPETTEVKGPLGLTRPLAMKSWSNRTLGIAPGTRTSQVVVVQTITTDMTDADRGSCSGMNSFVYEASETGRQ